MDPSDRTHNFLRLQKIHCGKVERFLGRTKADLFGFLDQIALNPGKTSTLPTGILGIQSTGGESNGNGNARVEKIRSEMLWDTAADFIACGGSILVFNWVHGGRSFGPRGGYELRIFQILDRETPVSWQPI